MTERKLTLSEFKDLCRSALDFLVTDYGFQESPDGSDPNDANPFRVQFTRDDLTVTVEGIHYGDAAMLYIQDSLGRRIVPRELDPAGARFPLKPVRSKVQIGQADEIRLHASKLKTLGVELLQGDFTAFERAIARREAARADYERRQALGIAIQEAVAAYRLQQWSRVIELLEPLEDSLSKAMGKKLAKARDRVDERNSI